MLICLILKKTKIDVSFESGIIKDDPEIDFENIMFSDCISAVLICLLRMGKTALRIQFYK